MFAIHVSPTHRRVSTLRGVAVGIRQAISSELVDVLVGVWDHAGCGSKFNLLGTIPFLPLAFRCQALYMYYVRQNQRVAETEWTRCGWRGGKEAHG